jgi:hypothetical protein
LFATALRWKISDNRFVFWGIGWIVDEWSAILPQLILRKLNSAPNPGFEKVLSGCAVIQELAASGSRHGHLCT